MRKFLPLLALCFIGCGEYHNLENGRIENIRKVGSTPANTYYIFVFDPTTKDVNKIYFDISCKTSVKADLEKGVPLYAEGKYTIFNNKRYYKEIVIHLHDAKEINDNPIE